MRGKKEADAVKTAVKLKLTVVKLKNKGEKRKKRRTQNGKKLTKTLKREKYGRN